MKEAKELKKEARNEFLKAKKTGSISPDQVLAFLAHKFFQSVCAHSRLNKRWQHSVDLVSWKFPREQRHSHFWKFSIQLLDKIPQSNVDPTFTEEEATEIFSKVYDAEPQSFQQPAWMPSPSPPDTEFNCEKITMDEIQWAIKISRSNSSSCPFDDIPYAIFKRCPALLPVLQDIFNCYWSNSVVPVQWKVAASS